MSRITAPASKLARAMSTSSKLASPSRIAPASTSQLHERNSKPSPQPRTFYPSPTQSARLDTSTIDFCYMPTYPSLFPENSSSSSSTSSRYSVTGMRMPLLPDNFSVHHAPEPPAEPLARPTIVVTAAKPGTVMPAALGAEVDDFSYEGVHLGFMRWGEQNEESASKAESVGGRMLKDIWSGLGGSEGKVAL